jgi:hypothetical protein
MKPNRTPTYLVNKRRDLCVPLSSRTETISANGWSETHLCINNAAGKIVVVSKFLSSRVEASTCVAIVQKPGGTVTFQKQTSPRFSCDPNCLATANGNALALERWGTGFKTGSRGKKKSSWLFFYIEPHCRWVCVGDSSEKCLRMSEKGKKKCLRREVRSPIAQDIISEK